MIAVTVNADEATGALARVQARLADLSVPMARIGERLLADIHRNFRSGGWFPQAWKPSERARRTGGQTLVDKGLLRRSMQSRFGRDFAEAGSRLLYARIHQEGGDIPVRSRVQPRRESGRFMSRAAAGRRKRGAVGISFLRAHSIHIPRRPFLPLGPGGSLPGMTATFVRDQIGDFVAGIRGG